MINDRPVTKWLQIGRLRFERGEWAVALLGMAVLGIFLAAMVATVWHTSRAQQDISGNARSKNVRAVGAVLAKTAEILLADNQTSILRRTVAEVGLEQDIDSCRIVLPDGHIIADADPTRITLRKLPDSWPGPAAVPEESIVGDTIMASWALDVEGRGPARLEITASVAPAGSVLESQSPQIALAGIALVLLLLVYRRARSRFRAIGAIRQSLLEMKDGQDSPSVLEVSAGFGPEAEVWNRLLAEKEDLRRQVVLAKARDSLLSEAGAHSELGEACDALPQGLILVDQNGQVQYANGAAAVLLKTTRDKLSNVDISQLVNDEKVLDAIRDVAAGPTYKRTILEVERDESIAAGVLRFIIRPVRQQDSGTAMVIIEDITQQRVAEEARNAFLAQATHELRTPLTNIRLYVETALDDGPDDPAVTAKSLNVINDESRRLERIVADILSVSEIEAGSFKVKRDDVRLDVLLEQIKTDYEPQAKEKHVELNFDLPPKLPVLHADRDKISLALHNLVGNALKYTPRSGQVTLNAMVGDSAIAIDVADTGIGISAADMERIFEKFYRAKDKRLEKITGSGLGLALAREVVRLHGGDITVQSELDKGSTFTLTLPLSGEAA